MKIRQLFIIWGLLFWVWQGFSQTSGNNKLYIPEMQAVAGSTASIPVHLDNNDNVVAFQFDLEFPGKTSPVLDGKGRLAVELSERMASDAVGTYNRLASNRYRLLVFSSSNSAIGGSKGEILSFQAKIEDVESLIGTKVPFKITNMILTKKDAGKVNCTTGENRVEIVRGNRPDLEVSAVTSAMTTVKPGEIVKASWLVRNIGNQPTKAGWKESVYLVGQDGKSEIYLGNLNYGDVLSANGQVSRNAEFRLSEYPGLDGYVQFKVKLTPNADAGELEADAANNVSVSKQKLNLQKVLTFKVSKNSVAETLQSDVYCYVYRSGDRSSEESFKIENSNPKRLNVPAEIRIPEGQSGASFMVMPIDDKIANPDSTATISIQGNGYAAVKQVVRIEDDERPYLKLSVNKQEASEGEMLTLTVEREWDIQWPLVVRLSSDHPKRFENFPSEVVISGSSKKKEVTIKVKDDNLPGLDDEVVFTASAPGHEFDLESQRFIKIKDNDIPNITLELSTSTVGEANQVVTAILRRSGVTDNKVTVNLTDDGNGRISLPASVVLEAGVVEKEFAIRTIDNGMKDGDKVVKITGAIYLSSCNCSTAGTKAGVFEKTLTVVDDDNVALKIETTKTTLLEGETGKITISVNQVLEQPLTVHLSSENSKDLQFLASVTIPAGQKSVEVIVTAKKNEVSDGNRVVTIVIDAGTFGKSTCWLNITDQNLPDAIVSSVTTNNEVAVQSSATVKVTMKNEGAAVLPAQMKVSVYLSPQATLTNDAVALGALYTQSELAVDESIVLEKAFTFPDKTGDYHLIAIVNEEQSKKELSYVNNLSAPFPVTLAPLYTVQVSLDKSVIKTGESVMITGQVTGSKTAGVPVDIYIINDGYRQVLNVKTDNAGIFQKEFTPERWQMGHFGVGACYPGENLDKEMAGFDLFGLRKASKGVITWEVFTNEKTTGSILLSNPGDKPLSNIQAKIISQPKNCTIRFASISNLSAQGTAELQYEVTGTVISPGEDWEPIKIQVASAEGAVLDLGIYYYCRSQAAQLEVSELNLNTTMTIGAIREYPVTITNTGKGETGEIRVVLPKSDWMSLASPEKMPSLKYGESATVLLRFAPGADMEANLAHKGQFAINCANGNGVPVSFRIIPVSSENGTLVVDVCDEYTYFTAEKPHVSGAKVRVTRPNTNEVVAEGTTGANGLFTRELPAGYYTLEVTADKHDSYKNTILVDPGKENKEVVDLSFRAITYSWEVVETEIEDQYEFKTDVKYDTNIPVPIVETTYPEEILFKNQVLVFKVKNIGHILTRDVVLQCPSGKGMKYDYLTDSIIPELLPQEEKLVYIKMEISKDYYWDKPLSSPLPNENGEPIDESTMPCVNIPFTTIYHYDCGPNKDVKIKRTKTFIKGNCPITGSIEKQSSDVIVSGKQAISIGGGFPIGPTNGGTYISSGADNQESIGITQKDKCSPALDRPLGEGAEPECAQSIADLLASCGSLAIDLALNAVPTSKVAEALKLTWRAIGCISSAVDCYQTTEETNQGNPNRYDQFQCLVGYSNCIFEKFLNEKLSLFLSIVDCGKNIYGTFNGCNAGKMRLKNGSSFEKQCYYISLVSANTTWFIRELFNHEEWYECTGQELLKCFNYLALIQNEKGLIELTPDFIEYKPERISEEFFLNLVDRWNNTIQEKDVLNKIDKIQYSQKMTELIESREYAKSIGYSSESEMVLSFVESILDYHEESTNYVCASISLQFSQTMAMTRQAFRGALTVQNGHESVSMKNVKLDLVVSDKEGIVATSHELQINTENLDGFGGNKDGAWTLDAQKTGKATILFIPTKYAAPTEPKEYTFGGTLSYVDPFTGLEVTRDLFPVTMTVKPSPNLEMDYFMQRDILGDDPLTKDVVEPMIPSEFSLLIHNVGAGDATNVRMTTKQPEITDNEKGLLVDFQIKTSQLNGEEETAVMGESVATDFGTIKAGKTAYAQWWLTSTLLGHFTDYKVEATHVTSYDNPDLSLLDTVRIHELIRGIRVDESITPKITGFMVNDIPDAEDFPDMMYLTDGSVAPVVKAKDAKFTGSGSNRTLTVKPSASGWNYISIEDPTKGSMKLVSVNGDTNLDTRKVWQTDRTLRDGKDPKYEHRIHVVDYFDNVTTRAASSTSGEFRLVFEERPEMLLTIESILGLPEGNNVATTPVGTITVKFNKGVLASSLTSERVSLFCQGKKMETERLQFKQQEGNSYLLDLSPLTRQNGVYTLTIHTSEIKDMEGFIGGEDYSVVWNQLEGGKVSLAAVADPKNAGTVTPASVEVDYGEDAEFKAKANKGYLFKNWTINDQTVSTEETYSHTAIVNQTLVANFAPISYKVEITYDAAQGFVSFGTGYYEYDSSLELIATPNKGYRFVGWFIGGNKVSSEERFVYKIIGNVALVARFEAIDSDPDDPDNPDNPGGGDPDDPTANEEMEKIVIQVYPTRVTDYVHVGILPAKSRLILFNVVGKMVKQVAACEGDVDIYLGDQPSGIYLLHILGGERHRQTVKLIKK